MTSRTIRLLALAGFTGEAWFAVTTLVVDLLDREVSSLSGAVSDLVLGPHGAAMTVALVMHGIGVLALGAAWLQAGCPPNEGARRRTKWGATLLLVAGVAILAVALFPTDAPGAARTAVGLAHLASASLAFALLPLSFLVLAPAVRGRSGRRWPHVVAWASAVATVLMAAAPTLGAPGFGALERVVIGLNTLWLGGTAVVMASHPGRLAAPREQRPV